ncbi:MAG: hypothetical protein ABFD75_11260 [Smithella sp.]
MNMNLFLQNLVFWGPGAIIAGILIWAAYRLLDKFIEKVVAGMLDIGQSFVTVQKEQAASMAKMAQGTEGLRDCINNFVNRDNQEHREIIILLKYTRDQINQQTEAMDTLTAKVNEIMGHFKKELNI